MSAIIAVPCTDTRVERLVVVGGSIAIPPATPGTDAIVIGTGSSTPSTLTNSTTESPNVTNKLPLESKAKSLTPAVVLVLTKKVITTPDGLISKMELAAGSVAKRFPKRSNASLRGCPRPEANVVCFPLGVNFKIELRSGYARYRFPNESKVNPFGCEMLETKTLLFPSGVNLRITPSLALLLSLLRETKPCRPRLN